MAKRANGRNGKERRLKTTRELYDKYIIRLKSKKGDKLSPSTLQFYADTALKFVEWVDPKGIAPEDVTLGDVDEWLSTYSHRKGSSREALFRGVRAIFNYGFEVLEVLPRPLNFKKIRPHVAKKKRDYPRRSELLKPLLAACTGKRLQNVRRNELIVNLLLDSALRRAEICKLKWGQFSWDDEQGLGTIANVIGKGKKLRDTFFFADAWRRFGVYKTEMEDAGVPVGDDNFVFVGLYGTYKDENGDTYRFNRLHEEGLGRIIQRLAQRAGVKDVSTHTLRHVCARHWLNELNIPISICQSSLGHAEIALTIDLYGRPNRDQVKAGFANALATNGNH